MEESAVIIFVRNPALGKVKTRLAKTIGDEKALLIYRELQEHTRSLTQHLFCDKFIFYADQINREDIWGNDLYHKRTQEGMDLGDRMHRAFSGLFALGYSKIIIVGSDCYELSREKVEEAFEKLKSVNVVIGPAGDGGYYLLGLKQIVPEVFRDIRWSTPCVLSDTIGILDRLEYSYLLLPVLNDIDEEKDLPEALRQKAGITKESLKHKNNLSWS